ncbi:eukaryotic translation initiation factor 4E-binding protein 1 isoform X2 [Piliocolobus tephrosceles]|uniref:eukaryotic translation initiation factor 4E-binding protein 1 isoform X2 n=1 Tax=Piliocolobus tephrosceles TaxID=591936 RepID=UPI000E6B4553|nr:eukaryotic translation initiation factor 4E-binding protein 1 isoform X2 [Piliocolobus tephrosceles]
MHTLTMGYYSAFNRKEILSHATVWRNLEDIMLSEISWSGKGTRIIYDRKFLMECRNSPVTKTPPKDLPAIPGVTSPSSDEPPTEASQSHLRNSPEDKRAGSEESQFEMDI